MWSHQFQYSGDSIQIQQNLDREITQHCINCTLATSNLLRQISSRTRTVSFSNFRRRPSRLFVLYTYCEITFRYNSPNHGNMPGYDITDLLSLSYCRKAFPGGVHQRCQERSLHCPTASVWSEHSSLVVKATTPPENQVTHSHFDRRISWVLSKAWTAFE